MSRGQWPRPPPVPPPVPPPPPRPAMCAAMPPPPAIPGGPRGFQPFGASPGPPAFRGFAYAPPRHAPYYPRGVAPVFPPLPLPLPRGASVTPTARPDPDSAWLEQFKQAHLGSPAPPREPPLRRLAAMKARAEPLVARLEALATDALAIDARVAAIESRGDASTSSVVAELQAEREARLEACERVRGELASMHAETLFVPPEQLPRLRAFMRRVQKKKARRLHLSRAYRQNRRRRLRHEASVLRAARATTAASPSGAAGPTHAEATASTDASGGPEQSPEAAARARRTERERAERLLLLLDIKERRLAGDEPAHALSAIQRDRAMLRRVLRLRLAPRLEARRPRQETSPPPTASIATASSKSTPSSDQMQSRAAAGASTSASTDVIESFEALVTRRRAWDRFLAAPRTPGASRIPPHWVVPPAQPPASPWRRFAVP